MSPANDPVFDAAQLETWCRQAVAGDTNALTGLLCIHHERLLHFAQRKAGVDWLGKIDPEDLLQEAYIDVFNSISGFTYRDEDSFYHWAARMVDHRFIDHVRHWRRQKRSIAREVKLAGAAESGVQPLLERCLRDLGTPSLAMRRQDAAAALMSGIACLPEDYRLVVQRLYLKQESLAAIAADMGRSEDAVRRLAGRALNCLAEHLGRASRYLSSRG